MSVENVTSASNTGQASISELVQVRLRKNAVVAPLFFDVTQFAVPGSASISFPRWTNSFSVQKLSGSQKGDDQEALFDLDQLDLSEEAHIQWAIKKFDQQRAKVAILEQAIAEATQQHAIQLDQDALDELVPNIDAANQLSTSASLQDDIVDMITAANVARIPKQNRSFIFGNSIYGDLLKVDGFVDASKSNLDLVRNGQIGTLYGIPVMESDVLTSTVGLLVHQQALAVGFGAMPAVEDQKAIEYGTGSRRWVMDQLYGVKFLNEGKLAVSLS